jgi:hypothetical protein
MQQLDDLLADLYAAKLAEQEKAKKLHRRKLFSLRIPPPTANPTEIEPLLNLHGHVIPE